MRGQTAYTPVDYLVIGHLTQDITPLGLVPGGTVSYAALTAAAMGLRVGLLTAFPEETLPPQLSGVQAAIHPVSQATTFENLTTPFGRTQIIHHMTDVLQPEMVPPVWRQTPIVHLGPIAHEVTEHILDAFPKASIGLTPQGLMRQWDQDGRVTYGHWPQAAGLFSKANAVVISVEDAAHNEETIARCREQTNLLVVTEGDHGAHIYSGAQMLHFAPPKREEVDATGAGDIFAAVFFCHFFTTGNIASAARLATLVAANSITRAGLNGPPQPAEVRKYLTEINEEN